MSIDRKALEPMIKDFVMHNEHFFGDLGEKIVLSEKSMGLSRQRNIKETIADLLIFSMEKGIIGIEIKTEYDNLQRLNRQMRGYSLVSDYVWIVCHDSHVEGVEQRLQRYQHQHVGIIAYTEFKDTIIGGVYKEPRRNPNKSMYNTVNMLWKRDIVRIMSGLRFPSRVAARELGIKNLKELDRNSYATAVTFPERMKKGELINNMLTRFGEVETNNIVCKYFINNENADKVLNLKHFNPAQFHKSRGEDR